MGERWKVVMLIETIVSALHWMGVPYSGTIRGSPYAFACRRGDDGDS